MDIKKKRSIGLIVIVLLLASVPLFVTNNYYLQLFIDMMMYAYLATSWNVLGGYTGQMANGYGVHFGIGAYTTAVLFVYNGVSPIIGIIIGAIVAATISMIMGSFTYRLGGTYFALSTVAMLHVVRMLFLSNTYILGYKTNGALSLNVPWRAESVWQMQWTSKVPYFYIILVLLGLGIFISGLIKRSKLGYYFSAISTNQDAASSLGINVTGSKMIAGAISAAMIAIGGGFYVTVFQVVDPSRVFGYALSISFMLYAIIGGRGTLWGPVIAACLMEPLSYILRGTLGASLSGLAQIVYAIVLMLIVYFIPGGVWSFISRFIDKLLGGRRSRE